MKSFLVQAFDSWGRALTLYVDAETIDAAFIVAAKGSSVAFVQVAQEIGGLL
jgi:hypothetical protein